MRSRPLASPAAIADDSVQPVPWVFLVTMRLADRRTTSPCPISRSTLSSPLPWPPLIRTLRAPSDKISRACTSISCFVARQARAGRARRPPADWASPPARAGSAGGAGRRRVGRQQPVAGTGDHHRIEHDVLSRWWRARPRRHRLDGGGSRQHADLHRADIEIGEHRVDLRRDEIRPARRGSRRRLACSARSAR